MKNFLTILLLVAMQTVLFAQNDQVKITDETAKNRLFIYATNSTEVDLDVTLTVEGTGFRQSTRKPRPYRVPAASKVQMLSLVIERGKKPRYTHTINVTDSLSRRAIRKPATPVKIAPKKPILVYVTKNCSTCDSIVAKLDSSYYSYKKMILSEKPEVEKTIAALFVKTTTPYETITNPIISLGGKLYSEIDTYDKLLEALMAKDDE